MVLLERLKAWGAVEKNGRRLHLINSSVVLGLPLGFGFLDALLPWLQHRHPVPVQAAACALQWINVVTAHFMPEHIRDYVAWHCATSEISIPTIARTYAMLKMTMTFLASIIVTFTYTTLIFSGNKLYIKYIYSDMKANFDVIFVKSEKKLLVKNTLFIIPGIFVFDCGAFYMVFYIDNLNHIDFTINFISTAGLWGCMLIPPAIVRTIYLAARLMSNDKPRNNREKEIHERNANKK